MMIKLNHNKIEKLIKINNYYQITIKLILTLKKITEVVLQIDVMEKLKMMKIKMKKIWMFNKKSKKKINKIARIKIKIKNTNLLCLQFSKKNKYNYPKMKYKNYRKLLILCLAK